MAVLLFLSFPSFIPFFSLLAFQDADIVLVEYALNDEHAIAFAPSPEYVQRAFERLLRKLLSYPNKPAVILLNA